MSLRHHLEAQHPTISSRPQVYDEKIEVNAIPELDAIPSLILFRAWAPQLSTLASAFSPQSESNNVKRQALNPISLSAYLRSHPPPSGFS